MKEFNIYLAISPVHSDITMQDALKCNMTHFLMAYGFPEVIKGLETLDKSEIEHISLIIDSGAFSAWSRGLKIDIDEYLEFCRDLTKKYSFKNVEVVNLDKIPAKPGTAPTREQIQESAEISVENAEYMRKKGIIPMEVFHQGEDFSFLDTMIKRPENHYIGISPANDVGVPGRQAWLNQSFRRVELCGGIRSHGFGVTSPSLMANNPWTSVDSATYSILAGYGGVQVFEPRRCKFLLFNVGSNRGSAKSKAELSNQWDYCRKLFPEQIEKIDDLFSLRARRLANIYSFSKAQEWIRENCQNFKGSQPTFEELLI